MDRKHDVCWHFGKRPFNGHGQQQECGHVAHGNAAVEHRLLLSNRPRDDPEKGRQKVVDAWVEIDGIRREEMPKYYTHVDMHFVVKGIEVDPKKVERAIQLAMDKYCSASAQLAALAEIKTSYEIIEGSLPE